MKRFCCRSPVGPFAHLKRARWAHSSFLFGTVGARREHNGRDLVGPEETLGLLDENGTAAVPSSASATLLLGGALHHRPVFIENRAWFVAHGVSGPSVPLADITLRTGASEFGSAACQEPPCGVSQSLFPCRQIEQKHVGEVERASAAESTKPPIGDVRTDEGADNKQAVETTKDETVHSKCCKDKASLRLQSLRWDPAQLQVAIRLTKDSVGSRNCKGTALGAAIAVGP